MPWDTSNRRDRLPSDWQRKRMRVLRRDSYRCRATDSLGRRCDGKGSDVDHIVAGDNDDEDNLQTLCSWHHARKSSAEGNAARRPRATLTRPAEQHPAFR